MFMTLRTWFSTVRSDMNSRAPISLLLRPLAACHYHGCPSNTRVDGPSLANEDQAAEQQEPTTMASFQYVAADVRETVSFDPPLVPGVTIIPSLGHDRFL